MSIIDKFYTKNSEHWPNDADGDVFRRLKADHFDFSKIHSIDFNIDLHDWPPKQELIDLIIRKYGGAASYEPSDNMNGYLQFQINAQLTYDLVMKVQTEATQLTAPFSGVCESWGVMQDD